VRTSVEAGVEDDRSRGGGGEATPKASTKTGAPQSPVPSQSIVQRLVSGLRLGKMAPVHPDSPPRNTLLRTSPERASSRLRHRLQCRLCTIKGGGTCPKCCIPADGVAALQRLDAGQELIRGIASATWITPDILAMSRPSTRSIQEYGFSKFCHQAGIRAIFNTEEPGEHPTCGEPLCPESGFTYRPSDFEASGIAVHCAGWVDLYTPDVDYLYSVVRRAAAILDSGGKIAVHCHAGFGRTGLLIACIMVYRHGLPSKEAIRRVRQRRRPCIQNKLQESFVHDFATECRRFKPDRGGPDVIPGQLKSVVANFSSKSVSPRMVASVCCALLRQARVLHGPGVVARAILAQPAPEGTPGDSPHGDSIIFVWPIELEQHVERLRLATIRGDWEGWASVLPAQADSSMAPEDKVAVVAQLLLHWLERQLSDPLVCPAAALPQLRPAATLVDFQSRVTQTCAAPRRNIMRRADQGQELLDDLASVLAMVQGEQLADQCCERIGVALLKLGDVHPGLLAGRRIVRPRRVISATQRTVAVDLHIAHQVARGLLLNSSGEEEEEVKHELEEPPQDQAPRQSLRQDSREEPKDDGKHQNPASPRPHPDCIIVDPKAAPVAHCRCSSSEGNSGETAA